MIFVAVLGMLVARVFLEPFLPEGSLICRYGGIFIIANLYEFRPHVDFVPKTALRYVVASATLLALWFVAEHYLPGIH